MHWEGLRDGASESKAYLKGYYKYLNRLRGPVVRISAKIPLVYRCGPHSIFRFGES